MDILFLGNYTQDFIVDRLEKYWKEINPDISILGTGFNQYRQELINTTSQLHRIKPSFAFISIDFHTFIEDIIYSNDNTNDKKKELSKRIDELIQLISHASNSLPNTHFFIDNFILFRTSVMSTLEYNSKLSVAEFQDIANIQIFEALEVFQSVSIIDVKSLVLTHGASVLFDERMFYISKNHWSFQGIQLLGDLYVRYLNAYLGRRKKCIVLDLDNTLWGGVIGDDGIENISLSHDGEGKAYYDFQRELLRLHGRGILLAISSKNTEEIAIDAIENHEFMLLRKKHFQCLKINWDSKVDNIHQIAEELNIGLDSIVFIDDSPFEREIVMASLKDVSVPELPVDSSEYPMFIRNLTYFDYITLSNEDVSRNDSYQANISRNKLKRKSISLEEFYFSLNMKATISQVSSSQISRIANMTQKTNQFNLRTIRYTESDIKSFSENKEFEVIQMSLEDRFGNYGIIGCAIIKKQISEAFIDTFVLSCRAFGRTAESVLLNYLINTLRKQRIVKLIGEYIPTKKNIPCKDFLEEHGFTKKHDTIWDMRINNHVNQGLPWIRINQE